MEDKKVKDFDVYDLDKDMLFRQARILYPEVEDWILNISIESHINQVKNEKKMEEID